ncbi:MAG TPA: PHP domain-containing protein [Vicinamibacterales bacterium]|nr:PHP domain-containing protein [Vicinamibacterales bacterium]
MIDLHLHTTASDGRLTPTELVAHAAAAGVRILAVTDHDTTDGFDEAAAEAARQAVLLVPGIEITAVDRGRDVHMLGYFFDRSDAGFAQFLIAQRATRVTRIVEMAKRLGTLGMPVDVQPLVDEARRHNSKSIGRPRLARAMIDAGYVATTREAFDKWLGRGCPAFVERPGASPEEVIAIVHRAGGLVSLAHPGRTGIDDRIAALRHAGLDAIEVFHSDHDAAMVTAYLAMARELDFMITGGSDFHGDPAHGIAPGTSVLPETEWTRLVGTRRTDG